MYFTSPQCLYEKLAVFPVLMIMYAPVDPDQLASQKAADLEIPVLNMVPKFNIVMVNYCTEPQYIFYEKK